ncbi:hypothetical protein MTR_5g072080 [Medicago truncatula]|uniref:Uncharacterized protein n=1 Tax=Medicago truncatula TaxID=3880 RepID=G7K749_MEDTR|nr:hypothetical protein MTR_5g072080 [Medicago truncatula]
MAKTMKNEDGMVVVGGLQCSMRLEQLNFDERGLGKEMQKKVDEEIKTLVENDVKVRHWSMFFFMGSDLFDNTGIVYPLNYHTLQVAGITPLIN